jgi:pyridinium-3,5-bisthiocarboxylic acid mononucleotide nickel chelatase
MPQLRSVVHLHLDPVGGIAGDMFVAAMLDAFPAIAAEVDFVLGSLGLPEFVTAKLVPWNDGVLSGSRFVVTDTPADASPEVAADAHVHRHAHELLTWLDRAINDRAVRTRSRAIFDVLAEAEARVHGTSVDEVTFHEVGAWDSIVDVVAAATVIERCGATSWSVGPLTTGSGRVASAHGQLPVPAPAVVVLLEGFAVFDDGRVGERVTPTGAAILRQLGAAVGAPQVPMAQGRVGIGFGTKRFDGISNIVRVRELLPLPGSAAGSYDEVVVLEFEIDDQRAEDLAVGLDHLRAYDGVLDVLQTPAFGKKGRMVVSVRVLALPTALPDVIDRCFAETTTLGVRSSVVTRRVLARSFVDIDGVRVKVVTRPHGARTAKAEMDDFAELISHHGREFFRRAAEGAALHRQDAATTPSHTEPSTTQ